MEKIKKLWLGIPESVRETIKEALRWVVAFVYSVVWEMVQSGELSFANKDLWIKLVAFRMVDRLLYLATKNKEKINKYIRHMLAIG